jgi:hypothetical protein
MITIELEGKEYDMPEGWNEVSIAMFEDLARHFGLLAEYKSQYQYAIELFAILTGAPQDDLSRMTKSSFETLAQKIEWTQADVEPTGVKTWTIDGIDYMVIKNLDSLEMGEVVSLELCIANSKTWELLTNMLPILIRKVKKVEKDGEVKLVPERFDADNYETTKQLFRKHLCVADVNELKSFF